MTLIIHLTFLRTLSMRVVVTLLRTMDRLPEDNLLKFNETTLEEIRKMYSFNRTEDIDKAIDIFDDWVKKQDHFVKKDYSRNYLERGIIACKGSTEKAKSRLDKICTMRTLMPDYFEDYDFENDFDFPKVIQLLLPKLTKDHGRVYWARNRCDSFTSSSLLNIYRFSVVVAEYVRSRDYVNNLIMVFDLREANLTSFLRNIHIGDLHRIVTILLNGYGTRLKSVHLLTSSKVIDRVVTILKPMLNPKLRERIHVHKDVETIYQFVPKEIIPVEYGGEEMPLEKIYANWVEMFSSEDFKEHWREMSKARTDESCRQSGVFNEEYLGMPGTFRALSVD